MRLTGVEPEAIESDWHWWLRASWQPHRHTARDVHPLLAEVQEARGKTLMTYEHVVSVLDVQDPAALVRSWTGRAPQRGRRIGLDARERSCAWDGCFQPVASLAPPARYCAFHAERMRRERHIAYNAKRSRLRGEVELWEWVLGRNGRPRMRRCASLG